ncbi:complement C1q tumor necrosis factor-related protein 3-like [Anneissia japonica]|uniref:complement C1q tumor necrosis factor-related protein 3-like n=1 Tax=Anneissia japonica TaxID=1529436 RepID=UPI001425AF2D|nr:complement C1q tumor necrosis factor-related protein 3-like [Anneissia japonica]
MKPSLTCSLMVSLLSLPWLPTILSTTTPTAKDVPYTCNMCCQGPSGQNGFPGVPGTPGGGGQAGAPGNRGDRGETGALGKKGEPGNNGLKGDKGSEGSPGKQGPVGQLGVKGNSGSKGEPGFVRKSAFTALRTTSIQETESAISFTSMKFNIGEDFNKTNGRFTCSVSGVYYFMLSFESYNGVSPYVKIRLNGNEIIYIRTGATGYEHYSSGVTLLLNVGDQVWLTNEKKKVYGDTTIPFIFSGFMVYDMD